MWYTCRKAIYTSCKSIYIHSQATDDEAQFLFCLHATQNSNDAINLLKSAGLSGLSEMFGVLKESFAFGSSQSDVKAICDDNTDVGMDSQSKSIRESHKSLYDDNECDYDTSSLVSVFDELVTLLQIDENLRGVNGNV
jgi:hypothetical protein